MAERVFHNGHPGMPWDGAEHIKNGIAGPNDDLPTLKAR
jgi:hypothetical protein